MKKILITITISATIIIFLLGFIQFGNSNTYNSTADVVYSINDIPSDLIKVGSLTKRQQDFICAISKGLIEEDINGNMLPALAESVEISEDGIQYEFTIRDDVYWTNGEKITPKDIVAFFRQILTEEDEENIEALLNVYGAREYKNSNLNFNDVVAITAKDNKVVFRLNSPDDNFLSELSKPQYRVRKDVILWDNINKQYSNFVYTGDYGIESMEEGKIILTRNKKSNAALPETISIVEDESEDLALASFEVGTTDIVVDPPRSELNRLKSENSIITLPSNNAVYLAFNLRDQFVPIEGRKSLYYEVTKALNEFANKNTAAVVMSEYSYFRDYDDLEKLQARKVMTNSQDEWHDEGNVVLICEKNVANKELANAISSWFEKNTDLSLIIRLVEKDQYKEVIESGDYDMALVNLEVTENYQDELYDTVSEYLPDTAMEVWSSEEESVEEELFNNYSIVPLIFYNENIAINKGIHGITLDNNGNIRFSEIRKQ